MLKDIDLSVKYDKDEFKKIIADMEIKLGELQRKLKDLRVPVIIVFEGLSASGKSEIISRLLRPLDPRGFNVYSIAPRPGDEDAEHPYMWRFWMKTPARGRIAIFEKSWYRRVLSSRIEKTVDKDEWKGAYEEFNSFERQLSDDDAIIIKFWLHINRKEQRRRLTELESDKDTSWMVTKNEWKQNHKFNRYIKAADEMIEKTDTHYAPWTVLEAHDKRFAIVKMYQTVIHILEDKIGAIEGKEKVKAVSRPAHVQQDSQKAHGSMLDAADLSKTVPPEIYEKKLDRYQKQIRDLSYELFKKKKPLIILYEGWDASGKGGNIKRLMASLDPSLSRVLPVAAPNDIERDHHYLWRFWINLPKAGYCAIFDRTWYGRVLVERVEGFCSEVDWQRAYHEINEMEEQLVRSGAVLVKFWIHLSKDEQLKRFKERAEIPYKKWKITDEDYRNREKWDLYKDAVDEMLLRTSTDHAPWTIVEGNCKRHARLKALKTIIDRASKTLK
jgi:AMP-polyphosphate phosphotransferase